MQTKVITMKQASHYLLLCILISVGLTSCHKDIEESGDTTSTTITQVNEQGLTQGDVVGYIYDEQDNPVADASVTILGVSTTTNNYGVFVFRDIDLDRNGTYIKATKGGYVLGSDMLYPERAAANYSYIKMLKLSTSTTVSGTNGGNIVVQGGGIITFPVNAFVNEDGVPHTTAVNVTAKRIAADDPDLADVMPGGLVAMDKEGYTRVLGTLGMVAVELRDANGNELQLADGVQATVQFPIVESQVAAAPDQIALWSFDEDRGIWIEEGFANKDGNKYVGEVSHFSFWNCDAPFPLIHVCGTVLNSDGTPAANLPVQVMADVVFGTAYGSTDSDGRFCGKMPKGEELQITIYYPSCEQEGYTFTAGPFDSDTELDPVTLPTGQSGLLTGTVLCDDEPVTNGTVVVTIDGETVVYLTDDSGMYTVNAAQFGCEVEGPLYVFAYDNETNNASSTQEIELGGDIVVDLNTCGECDMSIFTSIGTNDPCVKEGYFASVDVVDANGMVTYTWNNGAVGEVIDMLEIGVYCVTVTDAEGCEEISCIEFEFNGLEDSVVVQNASCDLNNGSIEITAYGGTAPYVYLISNESGTVISTEDNVADLGVGLYTTLVTDANGCTAESQVEVVEGAGIPELEIISECGFTQLWISPNLGEFNINFNGEDYTNFVEVYLSGSYCFDISNSQGCVETQCYDIEVFEQLPIATNLVCEYPNYRLDWNEPVFTAIYTANNGTAVDAIDGNTAVIINPLVNGYSGWIYLDQDFQMCVYEESINLPFFVGLDATGVSPSCVDCEDGYIDVVVDNGADCIDCSVGEVAIYDVNDTILEVDLSAVNQAQELNYGEYYVVVTDAETGCIIAHKRIEI